MKIIKYLVVTTLLLLAGTSCGKKIVPASSAGKGNTHFDEASYNYFYVEAIKQKLLGNIGDALKYFEQCIKINPESDASYYQMAQIVTLNGDNKDGKYFIKKALEINEKNVWYLTMLAGIYYKEKNLDSAVIYYQKAVNFFPERENLQLTLGNLFAEEGKYDKANSIFDSLDKKYGVNEESTLSSIRSLMAEEKYDEALEKAESLVKLEPDNIMYNGLMAEVYSAKGDNEKALAVYDRILERNPDDPQTQLSLCNFLVNTKNYNELFLLLNTVILNNNVKREDKISLIAHLIDIPDIYKDNGDKLMMSIMVLEANYKNDNIVPLLRPELLIKQNRLDEGGDRLAEIVSEMPDNYYAWEKLLLVYLQEADYKDLMTKGEECATRFNRSFLVKILYANGALENGKYDIALDELKKAEILAGNNKDSLVQVITMRADVYYRMKDYKKAFELFDEALKYNNNDLTVLNNYAYYLAEQDQKLKEAEEMAKKVIEMEGDNNTFLDTYGWVMYKRGKLKEAAQVMEKIIGSGDKPDAEYYEHYGYILKKERKCDKAIENWNIALKLDSTKVNLIKEIENCKK
jgi:tetratricopeptide (TPR) repeat protein